MVIHKCEASILYVCVTAHCYFCDQRYSRISGRKSINARSSVHSKCRGWPFAGLIHQFFGSFYWSQCCRWLAFLDLNWIRLVKMRRSMSFRNSYLEKDSELWRCVIENKVSLSLRLLQISFTLMWEVFCFILYVKKGTSFALLVYGPTCL